MLWRHPVTFLAPSNLRASSFKDAEPCDSNQFLSNKHQQRADALIFLPIRHPWPTLPMVFNTWVGRAWYWHLSQVTHLNKREPTQPVLHYEIR